MSATEKSNTATRVAVLGAGPGGYAAAFRAADLGLDVTLIDPEENPGGVCLYRGCIPSKAFLHVARLLREAREAEAWGISFAEPRIDIARLRAWKEDVVSKLTAGLASLAKARGVNRIRGRATFLDAHTLTIDGASPGRHKVEFDSAIIATGSRPALPDALMVDSGRVLTSTGALELADVPGSLLVVGGGYIGLELGTVYAALGSRVTVVEMTEQLLPGVDADLVRPVAAAIGRAFEAVLLATGVQQLRETTNGVAATLRSAKGESREVVFDKILVATGRRPNVSGLGLENTAVTVNAAGFVEVDAQRRTKEPSVFAIGDVAGQPMLAHKATHEGTLAADVIAGRAAVWEPRAIPAVVFTDPEIAWCGLTETQARAEGVAVEVSRFPWQASGRALTLGRGEGVTKILHDPETGRVLGVGICGSSAGELIGEGVLAIEMGAVAEDLAAAIHPHPTLSETVMEAADVALGLSVHVKRKR
jgi:dihydrolipoamide dehydrogenase